MSQYWLMKSEPDVFSIDDLKNRPEQMELWDGVRNYQARNFMMNDMKVGDLILFYHSNAEPSGVAGIAKVAKPAAVDPLQFDKKSEYYDAKSTKDKPRWYCVTVQFVKKFERLIPLSEIKEKKELSQMFLVQKGSRLSITPVTSEEFEFIQKMV